MTVTGKHGVARIARPLGGVALLAIALVAGVQAWMRDDILAAELLARRQALAIVLPMDRYDNEPLTDVIQVISEPWTGSAEPVAVRRARRGDKPAALVFDVVAPDGYAGPIRLLVSVAADGRLLGVRVTAHKETPGLGDPIDVRKSPWITGFTGRYLGDPPRERWAVKRDGGDFDQFASATVTPRAVVAAVQRTLLLVDKHGAELYAAPAHATVVFSDAPDHVPSP